MGTLLSVALMLAGSALAGGPEALAGTAGTAFEALPQVPALTPSPRLSTKAQDELLRLLDDADPAVRAEAAKALKGYAAYDSRVERKLLQLMSDQAEPETVRREALKSLALAAQHYNTRDAVLDLAADGRETASLRALAYKALYFVARSDYRVTEALLRAAEREAEPLRLGALWALSGASGDYNASAKLRRILDDRGEPERVRVEALKALFPQLPLRNDVHWAIRALADDSHQPEDLREAAILSLVSVNSDFTTRRILDGLSRDDRNPRLRAAAIKAPGGFTLELARFFHTAGFQGKFIDPLENE